MILPAALPAPRVKAAAVFAVRLSFLVVVLAMLPAHAQDVLPVEETRPIRFRVVVDAPRPYEKMLEQGLDLVRWQASERVTLPLLRRLAADARTAAAEALGTDGYYSAKVAAKVDVESAQEAVVRISVDLGPRTRVREVALDFAGAALEDPEGRERIDTVKQTWGLARGDPFRQSEWESAKAGALSRLARGRYAAARISESEAFVDPENHAADLKLKFDSGPVFRAGPVFVTGLRRYPATIVQNFNPHKTGEPYDATKLDQFQRRLLETGYFNAVNFTIDPDPDTSAAAPLNVSVMEARSQRVDVGIAVSTDTGVGLTLDYGNADLVDSALRFRSVIDVNQKRQRIATGIDTPPRPGGSWDTWSARIDRSDVQKQLAREAVVGYAYNWGLLRVPSQLSLAAHFERQSIEGSTTADNYALFSQYRRTFSTTEELVSPREGLIGTAEIGASVPGVSTQEFIRGRVHLNWLIPAGLRNDILVRGELGVVLAQSREGIPSSFLFRTGGDQTIRGYDYQSIGIRQGDAIVGGRYLAIASVEYTRWITDTLGAALFVDAGDAFDEADALDVAVGMGIGVRYRSPIGPVRADIAYGERTQRVRLHFSVGYNF